MVVNVSVDLGAKQLEFIERLVRQGRYRSRSEAVRDFVRRGEFETEWRGAMEESRDKTFNIEQARQAESGRLLKEFKGNAIKR